MSPRALIFYTNIPSLELAIIGGIVFPKHILFWYEFVKHLFYFVESAAALNEFLKFIS